MMKCQQVVDGREMANSSTSHVPPDHLTSSAQVMAVTAIHIEIHDMMSIYDY